MRYGANFFGSCDLGAQKRNAKKLAYAHYRVLLASIDMIIYS